VVFSDSEPGFYEDGKFGCRIEDVVRIVRANVPYNFKMLNYLTFETVSLVPIQTKMLLPEMLTEKEVSVDTGLSSLCFRVATSCVSCPDLCLPGLHHRCSPTLSPVTSSSVFSHPVSRDFIIGVLPRSSFCCIVVPKQLFQS
jgi:hypothetical protein